MPKRSRDAASTSAAALPLELRYFPLLAKGLGPALVLEHSQLAWRGNKDLPFSIGEHWKALKTQEIDASTVRCTCVR